MLLFVGLGNPGERYSANRHNIGFMAVDKLADRLSFAPWRRKFSGHITEGEIAGQRVMLLKPATYMNESGRAVGEACRFLKIDADDVIVFHDELDLLPGKIRCKSGGGNAGHNGLKSISAHIGNDYRRVRLGVGHPGAKDAVARYVLHDFAKADDAWLSPLLDAIAESSGALVKGDDARFLNDVATRIGASDNTKASKGRASAKTVTSAPKPTPNTSKSSSGSSTGRSRHPAGERAGKRQSALAENLKKWLGARGGGGGGSSDQSD